jgi:hypothetical protein
MVHVRKRKNGNHELVIRKKGISLSRTFKTREDAELWAAYKEDLIHNIDAFDVPLKDMITLEVALKMKLDSLQAQGKDSRDFQDLRKCFLEFVDLPLSHLKYDVLMQYMKKMSESQIRRGGDRKNPGTSGILVDISSSTLISRISVLSTVINFAIENGVNVENDAYKVCQYLRANLKKKSEDA